MKSTEDKKVILSQVLQKKKKLYVAGAERKQKHHLLFCPVPSTLLYKQNIVGGMAGNGEVLQQSQDSWRTERVHLIA